jgi:hypothetical protein
MKMLIIAVLTVITTGCATLTSDAMDPIALSLSDGGNANCVLTNKRGVWTTDVPITIPIRRSDDDLKYECETEDGRKAVGTIPSTVGAKIVASAVFIDFGITDAITDKHRDYPPSYVIPIIAKNGDIMSVLPTPTNEEDSAADPFDYVVGDEEDVESSQTESDEVDPLEMNQ